MTNAEPLEAEYFYWLYKKIGTLSNRNPARSHFLLAEQLHHIPFRWHIKNDGNRVKDGLDLRTTFLSQTHISEGDLVISNFLGLECSMLEMMIALCNRTAYEANTGSVGDWFWTLLNNLSLMSYTDEIYDDGVAITINQIVESVIERSYRPDGRGGLFPLLHSERDQRDIEIWYQMNAYLLENSTFE